ncbi:MAG: hypothetical protein A2W09_03330 [Deltaproteobacteria bacterium RBG_16_50_11]|nr:MAG: hypothetical protein A2W09_03330 [Deltaproteobacteria bacterium RBG_16_50_11]
MALPSPSVIPDGSQTERCQDLGQKSTHSTPRSEARGMPFDKLKAPSKAEGLSLPAGRQGLILSGAFYPDLKIGVWRRRTYQRKRETMEKVVIEKLPNHKEGPGAKRWEEERGEFVQIVYQEEIHHLALFEIRRGFSRGNHYHQKKEEVFYIAQGKLRALFMDMDTLQKEERILEKGDKIRIKPNCGHSFYGLENTVVVEYSPQVYEIEDNVRINLA